MIWNQKWENIINEEFDRDMVRIDVLMKLDDFDSVEYTVTCLV